MKIKKYWVRFKISVHQFCLKMARWMSEMENDPLWKWDPTAYQRKTELQRELKALKKRR